MNSTLIMFLSQLYIFNYYGIFRCIYINLWWTGSAVKISRERRMRSPRDGYKFIYCIHIYIYTVPPDLRVPSFLTPQSLFSLYSNYPHTHVLSVFYLGFVLLRSQVVVLVNRPDVYIFIRMLIYICVLYMYIYMYIYVYSYIYGDAYTIYIYIYIYMYICIYKYTYTNMYV
jgi:hypothetical protein